MAGKGGLAEQIRTGLEEVEARPRLTVIKTKKMIHPLDEFWVNKPVRQHVKEFGAIFGVLLFGIASVKMYKYSITPTALYLIGAGSLFVIFGYLFPKAMLPVWRGWMKFATVLGLFMTTMIIGVAWIIMLVPLALLLKILGKKTMDLSYGTSVVTYWEERDPKLNDFKLLERQY